ncbi:iron-containing redox enzyme family protein [Streptomyces sp. NPDC127119]|uniref:iron-containing redox enzyme family protein n=1 Tax=Streptomyces sp. NPDC127119 TaxID=3345370 RepID=UPI003624D64B
MPVFTLPDTFVVSPLSTSEFNPASVTAADELIAAGSEAVYQRLIGDQESEVVYLLARHVLNGFLSGSRESIAHDFGAPQADGIAERTEQIRRRITEILQPLREAEPRVRRAMVAQRAPLALIGGCWLDSISQPASQPATVVNHLVRHQFVWRGEGNPRRGLHQLRGHALEDLGVFLPDVMAPDFLRQAETRSLTAWHGAYRLSLARLPTNFLPEVVGTHYVLAALGVDELLLGTRPMLAEEDLRAALANYLALAPAPIRARLDTAITRTLAMELEHARLLAEVGEWHASLSLDAQVARIVARHAPLAGKQHRNVRVGGQPLTERFSDPDFDLAAFIGDFRASAQLKSRDGACRFLRAIKFGGPMFGIFNEQEAATFQQWTEAISEGDLPDIQLTPNTAGDAAARALAEAISPLPPEVRLKAAARGDDRTFFHRLVSIENFPNTLALARANAKEGLDRAVILFEYGGDGVLTDASWFDYTPLALNERVDRIYWDKLVNPYQPLTEIPDRDEVIFGQKTFALGSMVDGAWAHRIGATGRYTRRSDGMLYSIYADEMGRGDVTKNHITLIYQVLASMGIEVPHIRDTAFLDQDELPDHLYEFSLFQLSLALFPDSLYDEILGYNLGIEMFGLGTMRMHEMQKLRRYGFDVAYEEAHLSIDNLSAGHARQSAEIIIAYLHDVAKLSGADAALEHWERIWRGYASFAYFVEHELVARLVQRKSADVVI